MAKLDGKAQLQLDWNGGWGNILKRLQTATGQPLPDSGLQLKADLRAEQLRYLPANTPADQAIVVPKLALNLQGSPEKADISLQTSAQRAASSSDVSGRMMRSRIGLPYLDSPICR